MEHIPNLGAWDTSKIITMNGMFYNCSKLKSLGNISEWNISNVTDMNGMFFNCSNLTDESLNNIMASCISATSPSLTKKLSSMGITQAQATRCQSLSNYQAFLNAGWTTGY